MIGPIKEAKPGDRVLFSWEGDTMNGLVVHVSKGSPSYGPIAFLQVPPFNGWPTPALMPILVSELL